MASLRRVSPPIIKGKPTKLKMNMFFIEGKSHSSRANSTQLTTAAIWYSGLWLSRNESRDSLSGQYLATMIYSERWKNDSEARYQPKYLHDVLLMLRIMAIPKRLPFGQNNKKDVNIECHPTARLRESLYGTNVTFILVHVHPTISNNFSIIGFPLPPLSHLVNVVSGFASSTSNYHNKSNNTEWGERKNKYLWSWRRCLTFLNILTRERKIKFVSTGFVCDCQFPLSCLYSFTWYRFKFSV